MTEVLTEVKPDRGALCEQCEQWEYNEDGSCRTFMVCGACWNKQIERSRLERELVEAAKTWRPTQLAKDDPRESLNLLATAVDALIDFESQQEK